MSSTDAVVPSSLKIVFLPPHLKMANLIHEEFSSFCPISNLTFISKCVGKVVVTPWQFFIIKCHLEITIDLVRLWTILRKNSRPIFFWQHFYNNNNTLFISLCPIALYNVTKLQVLFKLHSIWLLWWLKYKKDWFNKNLKYKAKM